MNIKITLTLPLIIFLTVVTKNCFSQTNINVEDKNFQHCLEKIAQSQNWSSAEQFTKIKCNSKKIRSIKGINQFINIQSFSVFNNKINILNDDIQKLKNLKTLNISRNNVKTLTLTNMHSLETIYAFDNIIDKITLSNLSSLTMIKAQNNKATQFTYSNTPKLSKIYIFNNQLKHMNIYSLPLLTYVDCRQNPMPDSLYDDMDSMTEVTFLHDGNADDW